MVYLEYSLGIYQGWGQFQKELELFNSFQFNSIQELELELIDFEQKELELEINEKELILIFLISPNPTFQSVHKQQTCLISSHKQ